MSLRFQRNYYIPTISCRGIRRRFSLLLASYLLGPITIENSLEYTR